MHRAPQGVHDFLRAYYHHKSADWKGNKPYPLKSWTADEIAKLPTYYVMDLAEGHGRDRREGNAVARRDRRQHMAAGQRTGLLRGRIRAQRLPGRPAMVSRRHDGVFTRELQIWSGRTIDIPSAFISGKQDWGTYQRPGVFETMQTKACTNMIGCHLVDGAGHWVQQEQPREVSRLLLQFLKDAKAAQ